MPLSVDRFESLQMYGWRFGLDTIRALLSELGHPHNNLKFIHVAGTNGKGSTCAFLDSILRAAGFRTGLYTSPHLTDPRERFRLDGACIPAEDYGRLAGRVLAACARVRKTRRLTPTYFEAHTALAALWFKEQKAQIVVWETGLGGRLDATNAIPDPAVCLITPISLEHQDFLGRTLESIAEEKGGILKPGCFAATMQHYPKALNVLCSKAEKKGAYLCVPDEDFRFQTTKRGFRFEGLGLKASFDLKGHCPYHRENAALAVAGIRLLGHRGIHVGLDAIRKGLAGMRWPGRFELLSKKPPVLLDGAHNPDAARSLSRSLDERFPRNKWIVLNGFLDDKDHASCVRQLRHHAICAVVTHPPSTRAGCGVDVFKAWESNAVPVVYVPDWRQALALTYGKARGQFGILITGSLYLVGACREVMVQCRGAGRLSFQA